MFRIAGSSSITKIFLGMVATSLVRTVFAPANFAQAYHPNSPVQQSLTL